MTTTATNQLSVSEYLKRVGVISSTNDGYNPENKTIPQTTVGNQVAASGGAYNKDGSVNYDRLEQQYRSRNGVREEMVGYSPIDKKVYSLSGSSGMFEFDHPIITNAEAFSNGIEKVQTSSSILTANEIDNALYNTLTPEYQDAMAEMLSKVEGSNLHEKLINLFQHGSGIITSADYTALNTAALNATLVTKATKANILAQFFDTIPTNELVVPFDTFDPPTIQEDLAELEIPETVQGKYTTVEIGLKKDGYHLAWTRFTAGISRRHNVIQDNLNALANDYGRVINERIATVLNTATSVSGSSWSSFGSATDLRNANNPLTVINTVRATMRGLGFPVEFSLANRRVTQDYLNNTNIKGALTPMEAQINPESVLTLPQYGHRHGIDDVLADSTFWLVNSAFAARTQGMVITITYTDQKSQVLGSIGYNWNNFAIRNVGAGRRVTGVT